MIRPTPFTDNLPVPTKIVLPTGTIKTVSMVQRSFKIHNSLNNATFWVYEDGDHNASMATPNPSGSYINLVYEVMANAIINIDWKNHLVPHLSSFPPSHFHIPFKRYKNLADLSQNHPINSTDPSNIANQVTDIIEPNNVVHLHGAVCSADSDGWTDNTISPNQVQHCRYENSQNAALLWFHDHAMMNTRLNVYAGLAGAFIVRQTPIENTILKLPTNNTEEIVLVIQDRNLEVNASGFTGATVHATEANTMEFFGPYNLVNGKLWPKHIVGKNIYRLRIINGSNARVYKLLFLNGNNIDTNIKVTKIGTDQGFLQTPQQIGFSKGGTTIGTIETVAGLITDKNIILAPGERVDLLLDLRTVVGTPNINIINIAGAPYDGTNIIDTTNFKVFGTDLINHITDDTDPRLFSGALNDLYQKKNVFPEVMQFQVTGSPIVQSIPTPISNPTTAIVGSLATSLGTEIKERFILLCEKRPERMNHCPCDRMVVLSELIEIPNDYDLAGVSEISDLYKKRIITYGTRKFYIVGELMDDAFSIHSQLDTVEKWNIINLTADTHPFHIHLVKHYVESRQFLKTYSGTLGLDRDNTTIPPNYDYNNPSSLGDINAFNNYSAIIVDLMNDIDYRGRDITVDFYSNQSPFPLEKGWKDTTKINPGEMVSLKMRFDKFAGKFMYHCHILEHEDMEMMRPFVVKPAILAHGWDPIGIAIGHNKNLSGLTPG
jgi:FtsP/CotA-like multicopper oxidase with cupredoxin domain